MKIRKLLRTLHRDIGYFITGIILIYAISGIALNHRNDWNPHHIVVQESIEVSEQESEDFTKSNAEIILQKFEYMPRYKKHFKSKNGMLKVFVENGMVIFDPETNIAEMELLIKRPMFYHINKLHMAGTKYVWVWLSDIIAVLLIFVTISGLFLIKGKKGIAGRGLWLTLLGFIVPAIFLIFYIS